MLIKGGSAAGLVIRKAVQAWSTNALNALPRKASTQRPAVYIPFYQRIDCAHSPRPSRRIGLMATGLCLSISVSTLDASAQTQAPAGQSAKPSKPARVKPSDTPAAAREAGCEVDDRVSAHAGAPGQAPGPPQPPKIAPRKRVAGCLIPAKQAAAAANKGGLLLVDVRTAAEFGRYRIPGSLNIPPEFVKTKSFLKPQAFALVNDGRDSGGLEQLCADLKGAGYPKASVLRGGINGWRRANGSVEGDLLAQRALSRMRPAEYAVERAYPDWLVINLSRLPKDDILTYLPGAVTLPATGTDKQLQAALKSTLSKRTRKGSEPKLLIVDDNGAGYDRLEPLLHASMSNEVYFLDGGLQGYKKFWSDQAAIWAAAEQPRRRPKCGA